MIKNQMSSETLAEKCGKIAKLYDNDKETQLWNGPNVIFRLSDFGCTLRNNPDTDSGNIRTVFRFYSNSTFM